MIGSCFLTSPPDLCVYVHVQIWVWRSEGNLYRCTSSTFHLLFEIRSLTTLELYQIGKVGSFTDLPVCFPVSLLLGLQMHKATPDFYMGSGDLSSGLHPCEVSDLGTTSPALHFSNITSTNQIDSSILSLNRETEGVKGDRRFVLCQTAG